MKKIKSIIITTVILTLICVISAAGLAFTNDLTAERVAGLAKKAEESAMTRIVAAEKYESATVTVNEVEHTYYKASGEGVNAYIFTNSANGYGGQVKVMTGIDFDGKIIAIEVLSAADETPGLGQNVAKLSFWEQFKNLSGETTVGGNVQAVTGATYSSKAVCECVNEALDLFDTITKEGEK